MIEVLAIYAGVLGTGTVRWLKTITEDECSNLLCASNLEMERYNVKVNG